MIANVSYTNNVMEFAIYVGDVVYSSADFTYENHLKENSVSAGNLNIM